jgi:MFS family permease
MTAMTRTERTYYLVSSLYRLSWSALGPTYVLFLIGRGLDLLHVNLVLAVYLIVTCLFEVPTGAVADIFGRKVSFILSCVIRAVAFGLYFFSDSFAEFLVAEVIDAVGTTLATGAFDAWAVDGMRDDGDHRPPDRVFARAMMLGQAVAIVGGFSAAQLAQRDIALPWLMGTSGFLLCALVGMISMRERPLPNMSWANWRASAHLSIVATVRDSLATVRAMPVMRGLCLLTLLTAFAGMPAFHMWQPRLEGLSGEGPWLLGWVWVFLNLSVMAGNALIPRLVGAWGRGTTLCVAYAWRALCLGIAGMAAGFPVALIGFLLQEIGLGMAEPLLQAWMNEHATAAQRATILSVRSMAFTLGGATGLVCLGLVARASGIGTVWVITAILYAAAAPGYLLLARIARRADRQPIAEPLRASA